MSIAFRADGGDYIESPSGAQTCVRAELEEISLMVGVRPAFESTWCRPANADTERLIELMDLDARERELDRERVLA